MTVTYESNLDFAAQMERTSSVIARALNEALQDAVAGIQQRTQSGRSVDGTGFAPYSEEYRERKNSTGKINRPSAVGRGDVVNLTFSGDMLRAIQSRVVLDHSGIVGEIYFQNTTSNPSESEKAVHNQARRKFFGLSEQQAVQIQQRIDNALEGL